MARNKTSIEEKYNAPFPTALRALMEERGETQENIAKAVGKTRQTISQYVNGISEPGYDVLIKIADYFDVSIDYLLGRTEDPSRLPCAADELGLSAEAVKTIKNFRNRVNVGQDALDALSVLIEKGYFLMLLTNIKDFCNHISEDINVANKYKADAHDADSDYKFERLCDDLGIAEDIDKMVLEKHPEYQGRFRVFTGYRFIAAEKREIVDEFEKMLRKISDYDQFLSELHNNGVWL